MGALRWSGRPGRHRTAVDPAARDRLAALCCPPEVRLYAPGWVPTGPAARAAASAVTPSVSPAAPAPGPTVPPPPPRPAPLPVTSGVPPGGSSSPVAAALEQRLPVALRGGRFDPGRGGAAALVAVAVVAALLVGGQLWRSRPVPQPLTPPEVVAGGASGPTGPGTAAAGEVVVAVAGDVVRPGVVTLPLGSRVVDAVRAAGGARPGVDLGLLNLARRLVDGEQVVVGAQAAQAAAATAGTEAGDGTVDLNAADAGQLDGLPGIGPVLAERIVDWREEHGGFASVDQLREVPGIGESKYAQLESKVRV